jgi:hypothetical protein
MGNLEEAGVLKVRHLVLGMDEADWVEVWNAIFGER